MRDLAKAICFFALFGFPLNVIFTAGGMVYSWQSVSLCSSERGCRDQYIHDITRCLRYESANSMVNDCGDAVDPAYIAVKDDWRTRWQRFAEIEASEEQRLSPDAMRIKQEKIHEIIKEKYPVSGTSVLIVLALLCFSIVFPFACALADWIFTRRMKRNMPQETAPSTLVMSTLVLFIMGMIAVVFINLFQFTVVNFIIAIFSGTLAAVLALAIRQEFKKFLKYYGKRPGLQQIPESIDGIVK